MCRELHEEVRQVATDLRSATWTFFSLPGPEMRPSLQSCQLMYIFKSRSDAIFWDLRSSQEPCTCLEIEPAVLIGKALDCGKLF